jgi:hypothetical protein
LHAFYRPFLSRHTALPLQPPLPHATRLTSPLC